MKLRTIVKIAITSSVVLLCAGFALYSFFRLSAAEGKDPGNIGQVQCPGCLHRFIKSFIQFHICLYASDKSHLHLSIKINPDTNNHNE